MCVCVCVCVSPCLPINGCFSHDLPFFKILKSGGRQRRRLRWVPAIHHGRWDHIGDLWRWGQSDGDPQKNGRPRGLVRKCLECSQQRRGLDTAVHCTLRHAMHKLGYGILIQFEVVYVTHKFDSGASVHLQMCTAWVLIVRFVYQQNRVFGTAVQSTLRHATPKLGCGSLMQFDAYYSCCTWVWIRPSVHLQTGSTWVCIVPFKSYQQSRRHGDWCPIRANEATEISWKRIGTPILVPARIVFEWQLG